MSLNNPDYSNLLRLSQQPQFTNTPIQSQLGNAMESSYLSPEEIQAIYNAQLSSQSSTLPVQSMPQQGEINPVAAELLAQRDANSQAMANQQAEQQRLGMTTSRPFNIEGHPILTDIANLPANAVHDIQEIGTGLTSMIAHPIQNIVNPVSEFYSNMAYDDLATRARKGLSGMYNLVYGDVTGARSEKLGDISQKFLSGDIEGAKKAAKSMGEDVYRQFMDNPLIFASVVAPKATGKAITNTAKAAGNALERAGVPVGEMTRNVAAVRDANRVKWAAQQAGMNEAAKKVTKASTTDLARVLKNTREGDARVPLNDKQLELKQQVKEAQLEYEKLIDDNALVSKREMAAMQYVADTTGKTFQEVRRDLKPTLEMLSEGVDDQALRFQNRLDEFQHELSKINKENPKRKLNLDNNIKIADLTGDEAALFKKHLDSAELNALLETEGTVADAIQYLRDATRDALTGEQYISKAAQNAVYKNNLSKLAGLAEETGDPMIQRLYEGIQLADKGEIFPTTLAGADIPVGQTVSNIGRRFQGKSSSREFGTATPEAQAKAWKENILTYVDDVVRNKVENEFADNILKGTIDGERPLVDSTTKASDVRYLNPQLVAEGSLLKAVENATNVATEGFIPIDKNYITALKGNFYYPETVFKGTWGDMFRLGKSTMLASGNFLGGNILSGLYGTLMNSDNLARTANDFVKSIGAKGQLAKELGVHRELGLDNRRFETKVGKVLNETNQLAGGRVIRAIDALAQNTFAEMNARRALRQRGLDSVSQASKAQLGEIINDIRLSSMMPSSFRIIPAKVQSALGPIQPFVNWTDTALQVTYDMYKRHPYLVGMAGADFFGNIGIDKELQNRLGLNVRTDKMFTTYKGDAKTGNTKEITIDFLPQMTALKLLQHPKEIIRSGVPVVTPILNSLQGKNAFGNFMKRTHKFGEAPTTIYQGSRYRTNPKTGLIEKLEGGQGDEILSTAIRQLWGVPALVNRTVAPTLTSIASGLSGKDIRFYQPYGQSIFGSINVYQPDNTRAFFQSGNPSSPRTLMDVLKGLGTYYESDYYPFEDGLSGRTIKAIRKGGARASRREFQKYIQDLQE